MFAGVALANQMGPMWWRLYWIVIALFLIRRAWVVWRRLQLTRMAAGLVAAAGMFAMIGLIGDSWGEVGAIMDRQWLLVVGPLTAMLVLVGWEVQLAKFGLMVLRDSRPSRFLDRFTLAHIPDLREQRNA
jgi:hypothetical protein